MVYFAGRNRNAEREMPALSPYDLSNTPSLVRAIIAHQRSLSVQPLSPSPISNQGFRFDALS